MRGPWRRSLPRLTGTGIATGAILEFFRLGGHKAAFEAAFGLTFDEFHIAFEEHRLEVAPPFE